MSRFVQDWDGYDAKPFSESEIEKYNEIIESLTYQPEIAPTSRSTLYMVYQFDEDHSLNFEVCEDCVDVVEANEDNYQEKILHGDVNDICNQINDLVSGFVTE